MKIGSFLFNYYSFMSFLKKCFYNQMCEMIKKTFNHHIPLRIFFFCIISFLQINPPEKIAPITKWSWINDKYNIYCRNSAAVSTMDANLFHAQPVQADPGNYSYRFSWTIVHWQFFMTTLLIFNQQIIIVIWTKLHVNMR